MLCLGQILFVLAPFWRITCCSQVNESLSPVDAKYLDLALYWRITCCSQVNESLSPVDAKYLVLALFWRNTCCSQVNVSLSPVEVNKEVEANQSHKEEEPRILGKMVQVLLQESYKLP